MNIERQKIDSVQDINTKIIPVLNEAKVVETAYKTENDDNYHIIKNETGIFNTTTGKYVKSMKRGYQIIQHKDVFKSVHGLFSDLGLNISGRFDNYGNKAKMDVMFTDHDGMTIKDDTDKGINLGVRVINSYDGTSSFRIEMFGIRGICQNGMTFGTLLPVREVMVHKGKTEKTFDNIYLTVKKFIDTMSQTYEKINFYISRMMKDTIEWTLCEKIIDSMIKTKKHNNSLREIIYRDYGVKPEYTRWEIYNAVTNLATHGEHLRPSVENTLERMSRKIMGVKTMIELMPVEE